MREAGIDQPILVLVETTPEAAKAILTHDITPSVFTRAGAEALSDAASAAGASLRVHVCVDTGMHRVGLHPPGDAHQIRNASATDDLLFYLIADNPPVDYWHYPDSNKWGLRAPRKFFRIAALDYWDGEE